MRITVMDYDFRKAGYTGGFENTDDCDNINNMVNFIQDNFFNGADNSVIYINSCYNTELDYTEFRFELIPN